MTTGDGEGVGMKIKQRTVSYKMVEIGDLDHSLLLPMEGRIKHGMKTICDSCGKPITDKQFVAGFKKGYRNMKFHEECLG